MIANIILGVNIDTTKWISNLQKQNSDNIYVLDYDYYEEPKLIKGVIYISSADASSLLNKFDSLYFYKSLYIYPGGSSGKLTNL